MRKSVIVFGLSALLLAGLSFAQIDFSDFDDDIMRSMDDHAKYLDSNLSIKDAKAARSNAEVLQEGLKWAEDYFAKKGGADDAVAFSKQGQDQVTLLLKALDENDFDKASVAARGAVKTCRACHNVYKTN